MGHRRLAIGLTLFSALVGIICVGFIVVQSRTPSYGYNLSVAAGREGDKPRVFLYVAPSAAQGLWASGVEVLWNDQPFKSPAGLSLQLDSGRTTTLHDFGIHLPPLQIGRAKIEVTSISVFTHDGRALKFPGRLSAETQAVPRDTDFLLELDAASREIHHDPSVLRACRDLVHMEVAWGDEEWAKATTVLRRNSRAIEGGLQAVRTAPYHSALDLGDFQIEAALRIRDLGCLLALLGRAEQYSVESEAAIQTYLDTIRLGLGVAVSSDTLVASIIAHSLAGRAAVLLGDFVAAGSTGTEQLLVLEEELGVILASWTSRAPTMKRIMVPERKTPSPVMWYYSPFDPLARHVLEAVFTKQNLGYHDKFEKGLDRLRIVETAATSCRHYRERGALPGREEWPNGISIEPVSGAEWIVAESQPTGSENVTALCWNDSDSCSGRLGLKVRCGSG